MCRALRMQATVGAETPSTNRNAGGARGHHARKRCQVNTLMYYGFHELCIYLCLHVFACATCFPCFLIEKRDRTLLTPLGQIYTSTGNANMPQNGTLSRVWVRVPYPIKTVCLSVCRPRTPRPGSPALAYLSFGE